MTTVRVITNPNVTKVVARIRKVPQRMLDDTYFRLVQGGNRIRNEMINSMRNTPKTGNVYKRGKKTHIASSPGNAPAVDSGGLLRSLKINEGIDFVEVGSTMKKVPFWLEEGTKNMEPRPFLRPAVEAEWPRIQSRIVSDLRRYGL